MKSRLSPGDWERLLNDAVDGEWPEAQQATLDGILRHDAEARRQYLQFMQLHADLTWDHGAAASSVVGPVPSPQVSSHRHSAGWLVGLAVGSAVAAFLILGGLVLPGWRSGSDPATAWWLRSSSTIASLQAIQGTVSFRRGEVERSLAMAESSSLTDGTLLVEGESSSAVLRFADRSLLALSGDSELGLSHRGQHELALRRGMLTADVRPQPAGRPLLVHTPLARLEVTEGVFSMVVEAEGTRVRVEEGSVRLQRLVDGARIEIPAEADCSVSLDPRRALIVSRSLRTHLGWEHRYTQPPPTRWKGEWLPPSQGLPGRIRAVPCLVGRKNSDQDKPLIHYGLTVRRLDDFSLGTLPPRARLRLVFRAERSARLQILLGLTDQDGRFGGNFEYQTRWEASTARLDGWRELVVPLADFRPLIRHYPGMAKGGQPQLMMITTLTEDVGLEVSEIAIAPEEAT
jgi:ferric-dicitrate binding protein FerR (iron transport regulator)